MIKSLYMRVELGLLMVKGDSFTIRFSSLEFFVSMELFVSFQS